MPKYPLRGDWFSNTDLGLSAFKRALGSGANAVGVLCVGDSTGAGQGADTPTNGYMYRLRDWLQARYGTAGEWIAAIDERWSTTGAWAGTDAWDYTVGQFGRSAQSGATLTATLAGHYFDVHYTTGYVTRAFSVTIDGGEPTFVGGQTDGLVRSKITFDAGSNGNHVLVITAPVTENNCYIRAVVARNGNPGIWWGNGSVAGTKVNQVGSTLSLEAYRPALYLIGIGVNDWTGNTALSAYVASYAAIIRGAMSWGASVLVVAEAGSNVSANLPITAYHDATRQLCAKYEAAYINMFDRWRGNVAWAVALGYQSAENDVHPTTAGHADYAAAIETFM